MPESTTSTPASRATLGTRLLGILLIVGAALMMGFQNIWNNIKQALGLAGDAVTIGALAVRITIPYALAGLGYLLCTLLFSMFLVGIGLYTYTIFPVVLGGLLFFVALAIAFAHVALAARLFAVAIQAGEVAVNWFLDAVVAGLSWFGLAERRKEEFEVLEFLNEERWGEAIAEQRRRVYGLWLLTVATLVVFRYFGFATKLFLAAALILMAGAALAAWWGYRIELLKKLTLYGFIPLLLVAATVAFVFPNTAKAARYKVAEWDEAARCALFDKRSVDCKARRARKIATELRRLTHETAREMRQARLRMPPAAPEAAGEIDMSGAPPE